MYRWSEDVKKWNNRWKKIIRLWRVNIDTHQNEADTDGGKHQMIDMNIVYVYWSKKESETFLAHNLEGKENFIPFGFVFC